MEEQETQFFVEITKKALLTLENLLRDNRISVPVSSDDLLDIAIGAVGEEVIEGQQILVYFIENPLFLFDEVHFEEAGEYNLNQIMTEILCFRIISIMMEFLDHVGVEYDREYDIRTSDE